MCYQEQRDFSQWLEGDAGKPPAGIERARAAVHRNTFVGTLVEALAESFPVTRAMAGGDFFDAMARARVLAEPPTSPVVTEYAISFPSFVAAFEPAHAAPVLAEMATLEAMRLRAFHAADVEAVGLEAFHRLACNAALLEVTGAMLHPAAQWLQARHALVELWQAHAQIDEQGPVDLRHIDADAPQDLLVHRPRFDVRMRVLPAGALYLLAALAAGESLAAALVEAAHREPLAEPAALFSLLLHEGLVIQLIPLTPELQ